MLSDVIIAVSDRICNLQNPDGSFPAGHNGPYHDPETPVRTSGHWLMTFAKCYELTGNTIYRDKVCEIAGYLSSRKARPHGFSFHHRTKKGKDSCNGLMGQAWTIEALVRCAEVLDDDKYRSIAADVFTKHQFNHEYGLWNRLEIDGQVLSMDETFNHQLWYAACGSLIGDEHPEVMDRVGRFIECLPQNLTILDDGLIHHHIERLRENISIDDLHAGLLSTFQKFRYIGLIKKVPLIGMDLDDRIRKQKHKSIGYHSFNMYAFALLKKNLPSGKFWETENFKKAVDYMLKDEYAYALESNKYGYPYNPPGFEVPYSLYMLKHMDENELVDITDRWVNRQFRKCYNHETGMLDRNTEDPITHTSRIYELTRMPSAILHRVQLKD
jgi:hypothetical protein